MGSRLFCHTYWLAKVIKARLLLTQRARLHDHYWIQTVSKVFFCYHPLSVEFHGLGSTPDILACSAFSVERTSTPYEIKFVIEDSQRTPTKWLMEYHHNPVIVQRTGLVQHLGLSSICGCPQRTRGVKK